LGLKENRVPQFGQNPSVIPGLPSRACPTGWPQLPQNRRFSGTRGSARTAADGSSAGTGGISTSPAPSLPRDSRLLPDREPRLPGRLPVLTLPPLPADQALPGPLPGPLGPDPA
jgi:hypothetical protein